MPHIIWSAPDGGVLTARAYCSPDEMSEFTRAHRNFRDARGVGRRMKGAAFVTIHAFKRAFPYPFDEEVLGIKPPKVLPVFPYNFGERYPDGYSRWLAFRQAWAPWMITTMTKMRLVARDLGWRLP